MHQSSMQQSSTPRSPSRRPQRQLIELMAFSLFALCVCAGASAGPLVMQAKSKPVCDRIDNAPVTSSVKAPRRAPASASASLAVMPVAIDSPSIKSRDGGSDEPRAHASPRWQSFLPGMFK